MHALCITRFCRQAESGEGDEGTGVITECQCCPHHFLLGDAAFDVSLVDRFVYRSVTRFFNPGGSIARLLHAVHLKNPPPVLGLDNELASPQDMMNVDAGNPREANHQNLQKGTAGGFAVNRMAPEVDRGEDMVEGFSDLVERFSGDDLLQPREAGERSSILTKEVFRIKISGIDKACFRCPADQTARFVRRRSASMASRSI